MKKTIIFLFLCVSIQSAIASVVFDRDIDIYRIYNEDVVDIVFSITVNLYEPGYLSNVHMNGDIGQTLNVYGGGIGSIHATNYATVNLFGGTIDISIAANAPGTKYNVYGYGFDYIPDIGRLTGFWENDTSFVIYMNPLFVGGGRDQYNVTWSRITLHEVPEPASLLLLGLGGLILRHRKQ
jgi:hypothetical protein